MVGGTASNNGVQGPEMLNCSADKVARLKSIAERNSLPRHERACAQCKLLSLAGDQSGSRRILSDCMAEMEADERS